jgi:alkylation response protein AidB-like acyl-CoA dehydrogenase
LIALARRLACERFAPRADRHDRAASFPFDDYADLRAEGFFGLCVVQRARAAHVTVQRAVVTVTQEAIRVCGGRAFLRRYPLERYARDARAAALMRPWTQEIAMQQAWEAALGLDGQRGAAAGA